jgi:hypothetical protein
MTRVGLGAPALTLFLPDGTLSFGIRGSRMSFAGLAVNPAADIATSLSPP